MATCCGISVFLSAILVTFSGVWAQSTPWPSYAVRPSNTTGVVGYSVTIYCTIGNLGYRDVFWNVDQTSDSNTAGKEFTLGPNTNSHASYSRFKFVGTSRSGEFNLQILNVTNDDAGKYICIVHDPVNENTPVMEAHAILTVVDNATLPSVGYPECSRLPEGNSQYESGVYMKGDMLTLICSSKGGIPHPQLAWVRVEVNRMVTDIESTSTVSGDVITATAKLTLTSLDDQSFYKCIEVHPARTSNDRKCMTPFSGTESLLDVRFKPEVSITPKNVIVQLLQTTKVTLSCTANANPLLTEKPEIKLPVNKIFIYPLGLGDKSLVEVEMTTDDVGKDFYCQASNALGVGEDLVEVRSYGGLPTWLILIIIGGIGVVLFFFIGVVGCVCCIDRSDQESRDVKKDASLTRYASKKSRPRSMRHEGEEEFLDDSMIPIDNFQGGQELEMAEHKPVDNSDFETGERGPRYQNVNEAFKQDTPMVEKAATVAEPDVAIEPEPNSSFQLDPL